MVGLMAVPKPSQRRRDDSGWAAEIDDPVGETEARRDLDRPGHVHELDLDGQQLARQPPIDGGDRRPGDAS